MDVRVTYVAARTAQDLHAESVEQTRIGLAWTSPSGTQGARYALRRTDGDVPAGRRWAGTAVPVSGTTAVDAGLEPGRRYSYALFTQIRGRWSGPLTLQAGTASPDGTSQAAYVAAATTLLAGPEDVAAATPTGDGVRLQLAPQTPVLLLGAAVVLPQSDALPGGFLGTVSTLSPDGRTADLTAGGLTDAFDYYEIDVPDLSDGVDAEPPTQDLPAEDAVQIQTVPAPLDGEQLAPAERDAAAEPETEGAMATQATAPPPP